MNTRAGLDVGATTTTRQRLPLAFFERVARETLCARDVKSASVNVVFVGDKKMRTLNELHRKKRGATNVLSYLYETASGAIVGDVLVCVPVAIREAKNAKKTLKDYLAGLLIHGTLHLTGMTHETDGRAKKMEAIERSVLRTVGIKL